MFAVDSDPPTGAAGTSGTLYLRRPGGSITLPSLAGGSYRFNLFAWVVEPSPIVIPIPRVLICSGIVDRLATGGCGGIGGLTISSIEVGLETSISSSAGVEPCVDESLRGVVDVSSTASIPTSTESGASSSVSTASPVSVSSAVTVDVVVGGDSAALSSSPTEGEDGEGGSDSVATASSLTTGGGGGVKSTTGTPCCCAATRSVALVVTFGGGDATDLPTDLSDSNTNELGRTGRKEEKRSDVLVAGCCGNCCCGSCCLVVVSGGDINDSDGARLLDGGVGAADVPDANEDDAV